MKSTEQLLKISHTASKKGQSIPMTILTKVTKVRQVRQNDNVILGVVVCNSPLAVACSFQLFRILCYFKDRMQEVHVY